MNDWIIEINDKVLRLKADFVEVHNGELTLHMDTEPPQIIAHIKKYDLFYCEASGIEGDTNE